MGLGGNLVIGVIGAFVGGFLFRLLGFAAVGLIGQPSPPRWVPWSCCTWCKCSQKSLRFCKRLDSGCWKVAQPAPPTPDEISRTGPRVFVRFRSGSFVDQWMLSGLRSRFLGLFRYLGLPALVGYGGQGSC